MKSSVLRELQSLYWSLEQQCTKLSCAKLLFWVVRMVRILAAFIVESKVGLSFNLSSLCFKAAYFARAPFALVPDFFLEGLRIV